MKSRLYLPKVESPPGTVLEHLIRHFPHVSPDAWRDRMTRGIVAFGDGTVVGEDSPYRPGETVYYAREVAGEPEAAEEETVLYQDSAILVADKPHGMPVTPAGAHVKRSLLERLQRKTGIETLAPAHRLDRDTAGLVVFVVRPELRGVYQRLFQEGKVEREYRACARVRERPVESVWHIANRVEPGTPWFKQRVVEGPVNAITQIELMDLQDGLGMFRLRPKTGKKHQLRVHMASIGCPIVGDPIYGEGAPPLRLLAYRLSFEGYAFESSREVFDRTELIMKSDSAG